MNNDETIDARVDALEETVAKLKERLDAHVRSCGKSSAEAALEMPGGPSVNVYLSPLEKGRKS